MIALRLLLGKTVAPSCTYENKCCAALAAENEKLRALVLELEARLAAPSPADLHLQRARDENALQSMLIEQLEAQLTSRSTWAAVAQPADYVVLQARVAQLESKLADTECRLAQSVEAHHKAKAHITALQHQRQQLVHELEQMEDGFQAEVHKLQGDLESWRAEFDVAPVPRTREARSFSVTSGDDSALLEASLERTKATTRIWELEDQVERVRGERDALRRRLGAGRANLIQLKRQASEARLSTERADTFAFGRRRASHMHLNTLVRPRMRGEPLTPETSDDSASIEMKL